MRIGYTGASEKRGAMAPAPRGSAKIFYRGRSRSGIGSIVVGPVPVDQKPTKSDQPDADEQYETALARRKDQAEQPDLEVGIKFKMGTQGHQAKRHDYPGNDKLFAKHSFSIFDREANVSDLPGHDSKFLDEAAGLH
jgi:hypothetical protein